MFLLFVVSVLLLSALFGLKVFELKRGERLFATQTRKKADKIATRWFAAGKNFLSRSHVRVKHHSRRTKERGKSQLSRILRQLAERLE